MSALRWTDLLVAAAGAWAAFVTSPALAQPGRDASGTRRVALASIDGTVYDSIAMRPLTDALVQLAEVRHQGGVGAVRSMRSDSLGRYHLGELPLGTYLLGFQHVAMDSLGLRGSVTRVDLRTPSLIRVALAVPSPRSIITTACGKSGVKDSLALLVGSVRDARNDAALPKSYIALRWAEMFLSRQGLRRDTPILDLFADDDGWFVACVPAGIPVLTRATHDDDASGDVEIAVPAHSLLRRDVYVGYVEAEIVSDDSVRRAGAPNAGERIVARGRGSVQGLVRGADGRALAGARVALLNGASESRTDDRGRFSLNAVPHGTHTLEARALGYLPAQEIVDIVAFRSATAEFYLIDSRAFLLDTVRVAAVRQLEAAAQAGFERRRRAGIGYFLNESQIDSLRPGTFKDLVRSVPGIRFVRGTSLETQWREHIELTSGRAHPCRPAVYVDGNLLLAGPTDLDVIINPSSVRRVEVYYRGITPPAEFRSMQDCGIIAIWTGARTAPPARPNDRPDK